MQKIAAQFLVLLLLSSSALSQQLSQQKKDSPVSAAKTASKDGSAAPADADQPIEPWLERARQLTDEVLDQDRPALGEDMLPVLDTHLAQIWWKADPVRAQQWLNSAADAVEHIPQNEKAEDREARIRNGSALVQAAMQLRQPEIAQRASSVVEKEIAAETDPKLQVSKKQALSRAVVNGQMFSPDQSPQAFLAAGRQLVEMGDPYALPQIEVNLRSRDAGLADQLLLEAMQKALADGNPRMLYFAVASTAQRPNPNVKSADPAVTAQIVQSAIGVMQSLAANPEKLKPYCAVAATLSEREKSLPPADIAAVSQLLQRCPQQPFAKTFPKEGEKPEELVQRAGADPSARVSARAKLNAANMAGITEHDPERAMQILNGLTEEEKKAAPDWSSTWWNVAFDLMRKYVKEGRRAEIESLIDHAPSERETDVLLLYSTFLEQSGQPNSAMPVLARARKSLADDPNAQAALQLLNAYIRLLPAEAPGVVREVVQAINDQKPCDVKPQQVCRFELGAELTPVGLAPQIFDLDPGLLRAALTDVKSEKARASLRLGLIRSALAHYEKTQKQATAVVQ
jgi:hypothetical protein